MLPNFLLEETTVRESGESPVVDLGDNLEQNIILTLGITHAVEQESLEVEILGSVDGVNWSVEPLVRFTRKFYCGTYQMMLPRCDVRFVKAKWRVSRWSRAETRPYFRFYLFGQQGRARVAMAGAA